MTEVYAEWKKLRDNVKSASARLYLEKNENTESKYDEALERLGQFEKENGIPLMADEAKVKKMFCPQTNEEWFCSLSTEEKAKVLRRKTYGNGEDNEREEKGWVNWLKAKHEDNPPDIPSVPSWDRWLQGEKTKCEYCDGTNAVCNLVGRFECPKTPKTEQEYLQTCNTEQLADVLAKQKCDGCNDEPYDEEYGVCKYCMAKKKEQIREWLKQPHTTKE